MNSAKGTCILYLINRDSELVVSLKFPGVFVTIIISLNISPITSIIREITGFPPTSRFAFVTPLKRLLAPPASIAPDILPDIQPLMTDIWKGIDKGHGVFAINDNFG